MAEFSDEEKKKAVLVELVKAGVVDLESFADNIVERLPADYDPNNPQATGLGGLSAGLCVGKWFALVGAVRTD